MGTAARWVRERHRVLFLAIVAIIAAVSTVLAFLPWTYKVEAAGVAMPVHQHEVFAPWDGTVRKVLVESGQSVEFGTPLLRIESPELDSEYLLAKNERIEQEELVAALKVQLNRAAADGDRVSVIQFQREVAQGRIELAAARAVEQVAQERLQELTVRAPAAGVVATFQLEQLLIGRPVARGELLLEVMEDDGPWRLELEVPEYRMGHVLDALSDERDTGLQIEYAPMTAVDTVFEAELTTVATRSDVSRDSATVVRVFASIEPTDIPVKRIGTEVSARIHCRRMSLFYCLFGDLVEFVRRKLWL